MKIAFIRPNMFEQRSSDAIETVLWDERLEDIPLDENLSLAAITAETYTAKRAYQIGDHYRRRGIPVVMGGYHPTFLPEEALEHSDAVVIGDAEGVWQEVIADAQHGRLKRTYKQEQFSDLAETTLDRTIYDGKKYAPVNLVQYGRGCKYNCDFCSIRAFYGSNLRQRPIPDIVREIEHLEHDHIFFVDDNIFIDSDRAKALLRALIPLNIKWSCQVSIDIAKDPELVRLLEQSGCTGALIGFESLDEKNLKQMKKGWSVKFGRQEASIKILQDAGLMIYGTFVFGYDNDTTDSFKRTVDFAVRNKFLLANFNPLTPTPGTPLFDRLKKEKRLLHHKWWLDPSFRYGDATFEPRGMTVRELTEGCYQARTDFNTYGSIFRRFMDKRTNLRSLHRAGLYLMSNFVSRREIHAKQGSPLGAQMLKPSPENA
jgi:radical SAM superfamily enzyme YgiQ (UPF0313 family)